MSDELTRISSFSSPPFVFEFGDRRELSVQDAITAFSLENSRYKEKLEYAEVYEKYKGVISAKAFSGCKNLTTVRCDYIGNNSAGDVKIIGDSAFSGCENLKDIYITKCNAPCAGVSLFDGCDENYVVHTGNEQYVTFRFDSGGKAIGNPNADWEGYIPHVSSLFQPKATFVVNGETRFSQIVNYGMDAEAPQIEDVKGWSNSCKDLVNNVTCVAEFFNYYYVSFDVQGKCETPRTQRIQENYKASKPDNKYITTTGYSHADDDWYSDDSYKTKWNFNDNVVTTDTVIFAKWVPNNLILKYDGNGGTCKIEDKQYKYDEQFNLWKSTEGQNQLYRKYIVKFNPNYSGAASIDDKTYNWTFSNNWTSNADGTGCQYNDGQSVKNPNDVSEGSTKLYAQWDSGVGFNLPTIQRGEKWVGAWYEDTAGTVPIGKFGATYIPHQNLTAVAVWKELVEVTVKYNVQTFGASPIIITNVDESEINKKECEYGDNSWDAFSVIGAHTAVVKISGIDDASKYAGYISIDAGKQQQIVDFNSIQYNIPGTSDTLTVNIYLMKLESYLPYVATVNNWNVFSADLAKYIQDIKNTEDIVAMTLVSDYTNKFIASPGKLLKGRKYRITFTSQYVNEYGSVDDSKTPGRISIGHRGGALHLEGMGFGIGLVYDGDVENVKYLKFEYYDQGKGTYVTKNDMLYINGLKNSNTQFTVKPLDIDLTGSNSNAQIGIVLRDGAKDCSGVTFGGRWIRDRPGGETYTTDCLENVYKNLRDNKPVGIPEVAKTKINIEIIA